MLITDELLITDDRDWRHRARCRDEDPELFWPVAEPGTAVGDRAIAQAKTVCRACPVVTECLTWALEHGEEGIWGGTTRPERDALVRRYRANRPLVRTA